MSFRAGSETPTDWVVVDAPEVLVLVGPNNSGKSLALREIEAWCRGVDQERRVVADLRVEYPDDSAHIEQLLRTFESEPPEGFLSESRRFWVGQHTFSSPNALQRDVYPEQIQQWLEQPGDQLLRENLLQMYTMRLDGRTRFGLTDPQPSGDLQETPKNHLWALFQDDNARRRVRRLTEEAFGRSFVVDPTAMTEFRVRLSSISPADAAEEQALDARARQFHAQALLVSEMSDGVRAFVGLVSAVMSLPHSVLLIDEPDAFLHPPLARRLGRDLSRLARERSAVLVVATHSADFLFGCVEESLTVAIARLEYDGGVAAAKTLHPGAVRELMRDPLLRSTRALQGLFHRSVVVAESDTDRAFYDEINRRLRNEDRGIEDCLFLNAQNWQTVPRVIAPLRAVGVPAAGIVDLDALAASQSWTPMWQAIGVPEGHRSELSQLRSECGAALRKIKGYKKTGRKALPPSERPKLDGLLRRLGRYGLFVVPVGELESWLSVLDIEVNKNRWLATVFERLGGDPGLRGYVTPTKSDVWAFLDRIGQWTSNPLREGMAAPDRNDS